MDKLTLEEIEAMPKDHLTAVEASSAMEMNVRTFYRHINELPFPFFKVGRKYFIPKQTFLEYMRNGKTE